MQQKPVYKRQIIITVMQAETVDKITENRENKAAYKAAHYICNQNCGIST